MGLAEEAQKQLAQGAEAFDAFLRQPEVMEELTKNTPFVVNLLQSGAVSTPTSLVHLLYSCTARSALPQDLLTFTRDFFVNATPALAKSCEHLAVVSRKFLALCLSLKQPLFAVKPLRQLVTAISSTFDVSPIHTDLLQACLAAKCYKVAGDVLQTGIIQVSNFPSGLTATDILLYLYYGGMVYVGLKKFQDAIFMFQLCISTPASVVSQIVVEAKKKLVLASLIHNGEVASTSKFGSAMIQRHLKAVTQPYTELATAFSTYSVDEVKAVAEKHQAVFKADSNFGLVKQVMDALYLRNIHRLTQTYVTLSLADIAHSVKLPSAQVAEQYILRMIEAGSLRATINQRDSQVSFQEQVIAPPELREKVAAQTAQVIAIDTQLTQLEQELLCDPGYQRKMMLQERTSRWGEADTPSSSMDIGVE